MDTPDATSLKLNINGAPTNRIDISPASVKIIISCLVLTAPTIVLPNDSLTPPAELVAVGVQSILDSEVENLTSNGSSSVEPIGLQPNAITVSYTHLTLPTTPYV